MTKTEKPSHAPMDLFPVRNNKLHIGGIAIDELAEQVGQTPFYAYDRKLITDRVNHIRRHFPTKLAVHYAIKANPMPELVQHLATLVDGFDIASTGELTIALSTNVPANKISFAGPGKTDEDLVIAVKTGVIVNLESANEMRRIVSVGDKLGIQPKVAIRVNPDFELKTAGMKMGGGPKPFGIDAEAVPSVLKELATLNLHFVGFHIFSGSQNLREDAIIEAHNNTFALAVGLAAHCTTPVHSLNIGGGLGIPYFPGDRRLNLAPIGENLDRLIYESKSSLADTEFSTELGRYLVGEAGIYVCRVLDKKTSRGEIFLITDGGLHQHLSASGNFGQIVRKNYPVAIGNRMNERAQQTVNIVGRLCTPLDVIAQQIALPESDVGDLVVIFQSGAYGLSASPQQFLNQPLCREVIL